MGFYEILDQVVDLLRQRGRVTYWALQRAFQLDEEALNDLRDELLSGQWPGWHSHAGVAVSCHLVANMSPIDYASRPA